MNRRELEAILSALESCKTTYDSESHRFYVSKIQSYNEDKVKRAIEILYKIYTS